MNDHYPQLKGKTFKTWQELWQAMTDRDFDEVYGLYRECERKRALGHYRNRKLKQAKNLIGILLYRQKLHQVKQPLILTKRRYAEPLPNPKNINEIWQNLTDENYDEMYRLHCQYAKQQHNKDTKRACGLIWKFRQHCKLAGFDYPKKCVTKGFRQSKNHPWQKMIESDVQFYQNTHRQQRQNRA